MANEGGGGVKLGDVFEEVWRIYEFLERYEEPAASEKVQKEVARGVAQGERAVHMINEISVFSDNENIEEVATNELRYLLMPALLAYFTQKSTKMERVEAVKKVQVYSVDYLRLIKMYGVADIEVPNLKEEEEEHEEKPKAPSLRPGMPDLQAMQRQRDAKLARYKRQKENDAKLQELHTAVQAEHVDEEVKRNYYLALLRKWIDTVQDDLDSIRMELPMLKHMAEMRSQSANGVPPPAPSQTNQRKAFSPFILTKDKLQARVFGAGYPSVPTYSVEEWYDMQVAQGKLPDQGKPPNPTLQGPGSEAAQKEEEAARKEDGEERDDAEPLKKARDWDDWKDDHRRGWGNRQNMG